MHSHFHVKPNRCVVFCWGWGWGFENKLTLKFILGDLKQFLTMFFSPLRVLTGWVQTLNGKFHYFFCLKPPLIYLPIMISVVMALYSVDSFISGNILKTKNCVHWTLINFTHAVLDLLLVKMFAHYPLHS